VVTASNGKTAMGHLQQFHFDLIVTDFKMSPMNGLELMENIQRLQPRARIILMTAYGNTTVEAEAARLRAYRYLKKPLEIEAFRQIVKEATSDSVSAAPGVLVLSEKDYGEIDRILSELHNGINARYTVITDNDGRYITCRGIYDNLPLTTITSLLGGSLATLTEAGRMIDNHKDAIHLAYREGLRDNLYVIDVGHSFLLTIFIERDTTGSQLGAVWSYAQKAVTSLQRQFSRRSRAETEELIGEDFEQAFSGQLQTLMDGGSSGRAPGSAPSFPIGDAEKSSFRSDAAADSKPLFKPQSDPSPWADFKDEKNQ